ncbi:CPP1-like family protein [Tumidithrix helvetica PCC 7403]|uniref:CPP1-like family protein n=1 Tax=Tumidithrix helvetica TaxID=3457545 RepID=UPI003C9D8215
MNNPTPYERLGITEDASFEEVRDARDRLLGELDGDEVQQELIEAAYDAVLMDRLRARQEGKIKVPDRIRFPERLSTNLPLTVQASPPKGMPAWLSRLIDQPTRKELLISGGVFVGLDLLSALLPTASTTCLALGILSSIYLVTRKENRFGRALLIAFAGIAVGLVLAGLLDQVLILSRLSGGTFPGPLTMIVILLVMWVFTAFLR